MKGIEKITEKILKDAKQEAYVVVQAAQVEADRIIKEYEEAAKNEKEKIIKNANEKEKDLYKHISDMANLESRKELLRVKQELLDIVFKEAFLKLANLNKDLHIAFLAKMASEASLEGKDSVILSDFDKKTIGDAVIETANDLLRKAGKNAALTLSDEVRDINGGLILKNGAIETNCTYEVLYKTLRNELAADVAVRLFA